MELETEGHLVSDRRLLPHRVYKQIGMTFVGLCFLVGAVYAGYTYYAAPVLKAEQVKQGFDAIVAELSERKAEVVYEIVPNAREVLQVPTPIPATLDEYKSEFLRARENISAVSDAEAPTAYNTPVGEMTYVEYLSNLPLELQQPLYQMHVELRDLTSMYNNQYPQITLAERAGQADSLLFRELAEDASKNLSVYPSRNVVEATLIRYVLEKQFPSQANQTEDYIRDFIASGVAYGHYTEAEALSAMMLAEEYIRLAEKSDTAAIVFQSLE